MKSMQTINIEIHTVEMGSTTIKNLVFGPRF